MSNGLGLVIEQRQKLAMTQELAQSIKILQLNSIELDAYVQEQILQNPLLEFDNGELQKPGENSNAADPDSAENAQDDLSEKKTDSESDSERSEEDESFREMIQNAGYDDISYHQKDYTAKEEKKHNYEEYTTEKETLSAFLLHQLTETSLAGKDLKIGAYIIDEIDENGYLTSNAEHISKCFDVPIERVQKIIRVIQTFDPAGVGARNLEECLEIQLKQKKMWGPLAALILRDHMEDLSRNRLAEISKALHVKLSEIQGICDTIRTLEPKPGSNFFNGKDVRYITPDIFVQNIGGEALVVTNDQLVPHLMIGSYYASLLNSSGSDQELHEYLKEKYNSALWLIRSIDQRTQTIYRIAEEIVGTQKDFFRQKGGEMKPMTMSVVAQKLGIHESTVSRAVNGKYMQTPKGTFELKYFFSSAISKGGSEETIASNSIRKLVGEMIRHENKRRPLSDQDITEKLKKEGYEISRRTVAKYREAMGIPSSSARRRG